MTDQPISARLLFDPALTVVCGCGRAMTASRLAADGPNGDRGPLDGSHGQAVLPRYCKSCNVQLDIVMYA